MHYLLVYELAADYLERRAALREAHLQRAWKAQGNGALSDPMDTAVLLFQGDSPKTAEEFACADPYVINGPGETVVCAAVEDRGRSKCSKPGSPNGKYLLVLRSARHPKLN